MLTLAAAAVAVMAATVVMVVVMVVMMFMIVIMVMVMMLMVVFVMMHDLIPPCGIFLLLYLWEESMSKHLFSWEYPPYGLAKQQKMGYNVSKQRKEHGNMSDHHEHDHTHGYFHAHGITHSHGHVHANQKAVLNRLARAIGHLEKVKRMVEEGYDCSEVLVQLAAVRSAIDNTGKVILQDHMRHCMVDAVAAGDSDAIEDLCSAIERYMK